MNLRLKLFGLPLLLVAATSGCVSATPGANSILGETAIELAGAPSQDPSGSASSDAEVTLDLQAELKVSAQAGSGLQVKLEEVRVGRANTMLVIQTPGGLVLGTLLLSPGSEPLSIPLSTAVARTGLLSAALYLDDGDRRFDATRDSVLIDDDGSVMRVFFEYQLTSNSSSPSPSASPSPTSPKPTPSDSESSEDEVETEDEDREQEDR